MRVFLSGDYAFLFLMCGLSGASGKSMASRVLSIGNSQTTLTHCPKSTEVLSDDKICR